MIKLNNKNITYVALADSNNSLKAPKEIWYADSNSSVKLVYRRKDALIEDEDYEKYHWILTDTGTPYIRIANGDNTDNDAYLETTFKCASVNNDKDIIIGFGGDNSLGYRLFVVGQAVFIDIHKRTSGVLTSKRLSFSYPPYQVCHVFVNSNRYEFNNVAGTYELGNGFDAAIKQFFTVILTNQNNNDMHYAETKMRVNNVEYDLIPCKLLKPVPKWLDANGIRRQVGECGMIDLVSGKFYGNVNSVGTFTVENYYERKEWLQGRNGAYINTNYYIKTIEDSFESAIKYDGNSVNPDNREQWIFGVWNNSDVIGNYIARADNKLGVLYKVDNQSWCRCTESSIHKFKTFVNGSLFYCIDNGLQFSDSTNGLTEKTINSPCYLYACNGLDAAQYFHGDIAYFKITDTSSNTKMNLIPCILTMDLPASMDANNIARTKGTSGMWDLVSDRFYGNVASSGTFKAVNLAEGVDYEVHQWLKGDGTARISTNETISSTDKVECVIKPTAAIETTGIWQYVYCNNGGDNDFTFMLVLDNPTSMYFRHYRTGSVYTPNDIYTIEHSINSVSVNGTQLEHRTENQYVETDRKLGLFCAGDNPYAGSTHIYTGYIGEFKLIDKLSLTPCRLLRSIPSKYDANGIARQAGECGMYDTVNDLFYGNVASSGTFTVEDDN